MITNMTMPKMSGSKLAEKLLKIRMYLPIILCTAYSESINEDDACAKGRKAFITKPFNNTDFIDVIQSVL